jgi:hypothetical protein
MVTLTDPSGGSQMSVTPFAVRDSQVSATR